MNSDTQTTPTPEQAAVWDATLTRAMREADRRCQHCGTLGTHCTMNHVPSWYCPVCGFNWPKHKGA